MTPEALQEAFLEKYGYDENINMDSDATFYVLSGSESNGSDIKEELLNILEQAFLAGKNQAVDYIEARTGKSVSAGTLFHTATPALMDEARTS